MSPRRDGGAARFSGGREKIVPVTRHHPYYLRKGHQSRGQRDSVNNTGGIQELPVEMVDKIMGKLVEDDVNSGLQARLVCSTWRDLIRSRLSFKVVLQDDTIDNLISVSPNFQLKAVMLTKLQQSTIRFEGGRRTSRRNYHPHLFRLSVEHVIIGGDAGVLLHTSCKEDLPFSLSTGFAEEPSSLATVDESMSGLDLVAVLPQFQNVKTLSVSSIAFLSSSIKLIRQLDLRNYSQLTTFDVCFGKRTDVRKMSTLFNKAFFPNLSSLFIRVYFSCLHFSAFIAVYKLIAKHRCSLKKLSFVQAQAYYAVGEAEITRKDLQLAEYPNLRAHLMEVQLNYLRMDFMIYGHPIGDEWKTLERDFVKNQSQLRSVELQIMLRSMPVRLDQLLPTCGATLERLEITSGYCQPNIFDCTTISQFSKLQHCHLYLRNPESTQMNFYAVEILNLAMLPPCIVNLHLGCIPPPETLEHLIGKLVDLERVSYGINGEAINISPLQFLFYFVNHLGFLKLTEYRLYQYCLVETLIPIIQFFNKLEGLFSYVEDGDTVVVAIDRDLFNMRDFMARVFILI